MSFIRTWPARIYLQQGDEKGEYPGADNVTWHDAPVFGADVEYVRIDLYNSLRAQLKKRGSDTSIAEHTK